MTTQTSVNNLFSNNDIEIKRSETGGNVELEIINSDNSSTSSRSILKVETGGASGGDPSIIYSTTANSFSIGIDNSDSDSLVISESSSLGTDNIARCDTSGLWTYPSNSCFSSNANGTDASNVTGSGTVYNPHLSTTVWNLGSDYSTGTYTFTAPQDGIYIFNTGVNLTGNSALRYTFSGITYTGGAIDSFQGHGDSSINGNENSSCILQLDEGDTVIPYVIGDNEASDICDFDGDARFSFFTGALVS